MDNDEELTYREIPDLDTERINDVVGLHRESLSPVLPLCEFIQWLAQNRCSIGFREEIKPDDFIRGISEPHYLMFLQTPKKMLIYEYSPSLFGDELALRAFLERVQRRAKEILD